MDNLKKIRTEIDKIDEKITKLLKKRLLFIQEIGKIKCQKKAKIENKKREKKILSKLETKFEKEIFKKILTESKKIQKRSLT